MTAILLGMTRLDPFNANAQPEPPDGEFAQVEQSVCGSEGDAVIATDVGGQATLFKKPLKQSKSKGFLGGGKSFAGQQISAGMIGDGQRVAVLTIAQQELTFVIGAPQFIGTLA
jgi:hypothetical protein